MSDFDLLVVGDCNPDLVVAGECEPAFGQVERTVDSAHLEVGGSATLTACAAARLGLRTAIVTVLGDDVFGRFMLDSLGELGVETRWCVVDPATPTGLSVILTRPDGDRAILTSAGTLATIGPEHVPAEALRAARHVHIGGFFLMPRLQVGAADILRVGRDAGATTSLDTGWDPSESWDGGLFDALAATDWFFPNEQELRLISGEADLEIAAARLAARGTGVVVKLGADGGLVHSGQSVNRAPALKVSVVDTVGAGDCFAAGFLAGQLRGMTLDRSLALACACGSLSTQIAGGIAGQPTLAQAIAPLDSAGAEADADSRLTAT